MRVSRLFFAFPLLAACSVEATDTTPTTEPIDKEPEPIASPVKTPDPVVTTACEPLHPRTVPLEIAVLPEAGEAPFVDALTKAKTEIHVMIYQMGYGGILDKLQEKAKAGVKVKVILDVGQKDVNDKYRIVLEAAGAEVKWSDPKFPYMHAKMLLIDNAEAVLSTGNYSKSYMLKERNFVATDRDPADLAVLKTIFDADYAGVAPDLSCTRMLVAPVNAKDRLLDFIKSAKTSLLIESMQFGDYSIRDAVLDRAKNGVAVRVLLADPNWIDSNMTAFGILGQANIPAKTRPHLHVKAIVVDGKAAFVGSVNLSSTSLNKNREIALLTDDPKAVAQMVATFETDWTIGTVPVVN